MSRNVVVLPQPDGPTSASNSRSASSRQTRCNATTLRPFGPWKVLLTSWSLTRATGGIV